VGLCWASWRGELGLGENPCLSDMWVHLLAGYSLDIHGVKNLPVPIQLVIGYPPHDIYGRDQPFIPMPVGLDIRGYLDP
jgi:hypothetical protein